MRDKNDYIEYNISNGDKPNTKEVTIKFTFATDIDAMQSRDLGKTKQICKICGANGEYQTWRIREMQYGTRDEFIYFECTECTTLQIEEFPDNIGYYYSSSEYYSYGKPEIKMPPPGTPKDARMILDVGCGAGKWLCSLASMGFVNLYGCDPFIEKDVKYPNGVKLYKKTIHEMDGKFDIIQFNDSLEHMSDPHDVFISADRLLKQNATLPGAEEPKIEIILPIHPSMTVDIYGVHSFALDAPRHFFLYSEKALVYMAEKYGFYIAERVNRPIWGHFAISRGYQKDIKWTEFWQVLHKGDIWENSKEQERLYEALAYCASALDFCDHAKFTLKRR